MWHNRNMKLKDVELNIRVTKEETTYRELIEELENVIDRLKIAACNKTKCDSLSKEGVAFELVSK